MVHSSMTTPGAETWAGGRSSFPRREPMADSIGCSFSLRPVEGVIEPQGVNSGEWGERPGARITIN